MELYIICLSKKDIFKIKFLSIASSAVISENSIRKSIDNNRFHIFGGSNWNNGAYIVLRGKDDIESGQFTLSANNGKSFCALDGKPDGTLIWNNKSLSDISVNTKSILENGYISFNCGLILQWIHKVAPISDNVITDTKEKLIEYSLNISPVNAALPLAIYGNTGNYNISIASIADNGGNKNKVVVRYHSLKENESISAATTIFAVCI